MQYIKAGIPDIEPKKAYDAGYYVEAIQIMHGFIENQAQSYLTLIGSRSFNANMDETSDLCDTLSLTAVLKVLYILNQIKKEEIDSFNQLNSLRNKVIHQLYKEPYDKTYLGVSKQEYDDVFNGMMDKLYFFTHKSEELVK